MFPRLRRVLDEHRKASINAATTMVSTKICSGPLSDVAFGFSLKNQVNMSAMLSNMVLSFVMGSLLEHRLRSKHLRNPACGTVSLPKTSVKLTVLKTMKKSVRFVFQGSPNLYAAVAAFVQDQVPVGRLDDDTRTRLGQLPTVISDVAALAVRAIEEKSTIRD